jgi:hypothetical protein
MKTLKCLLLCLAISIYSCSENSDDSSIICEGDVFLNSQSEVDAFGNSNCTEIIGSLIINDFDDNNIDITNLDALSNLIKISNGLSISGNPLLSNLNGLNNLIEVSS